MTHHTEAELLPCPFCGENCEERSEKGWYACSNIDCPAFHLQALKEEWNRRAPAAPVPNGWKLVPVEPTDDQLKEAVKTVLQCTWTEAQDSHEFAAVWEEATNTYRAMIAAAPQPPEAAPVQMPEPAAYVHTPSFVSKGQVRPVVSFEKYEDDHSSGIYSLRTPLYTEQQVRELLAGHGIK